MSEDEERPHKDNSFFRQMVGLLALFGSLAGFGALFVLIIPPENKDAMMFALGIVFGWGGAVVSSEYGATTTGRKVAESAIRKIERQDSAAQDVNIVNPPSDPANVTEPIKP